MSRGEGGQEVQRRHQLIPSPGDYREDLVFLVDLGSAR